MEEEVNQIRKKLRKCEENVGVCFYSILENIISWGTQGGDRKNAAGYYPNEGKVFITA